MFCFRYIILILLVTKIYSNTLDVLVKRVSKEDGIFTVWLFQTGNVQLDEILVQIFNTPTMVFTSVPKDLNPDTQFNKNILLVLVFMDTEEEHYYFNEIKNLVHTLAVRKFVVVICGNSVHNLERYFIWLTKRKFTRIFGVLGNQTFTYFPYAVNKLRQVPENGPLPNSMRDLNGFNIRTNVQMDAPRAFAYRNKNGQRVIAGYAAETFLGFIRKHNARYTEIPLNSSLEYDIPRLINATNSGELDLSMNPYVILPSTPHTYSFKSIRWVILIPHNEYINPNQYFTRPFTLGVWMSIAMLVGYITLLNIVMDFFLQLRTDSWHSFSRTICAFLNVSSERDIQHAFRFHSQVLLIAFVLYNLYSVHLTSFLTVFIKAPQANTLQDLVDNQIRILMIDTEVVLLNLANLPRGFEDIVIGVPTIELDKHRYSARNKSFAYAAAEDKAFYILSQQKNLFQPNFHISTDSILDGNFAFILPKDSPFEDILNAHVLRQVDMGLIDKWERDAVHHGVEAGILHMLKYKGKMPIALTLRHLSFAWNCLAIGLVGASVVFLAEICKDKIFKFMYRTC